MRRSPILLAAPLALATAAAPTPGPVPAPAPGVENGTVTLHVTNLRNARGRVHIDLCPQANFLKDNCPYAASAPAQSPVTTVVMRGVAPGRYAAQLFHDENANDKMDRGLFGIPKEGIAFSRDAPIHMSPPKWSDAEFVVAAGAQALQVKMRYFTGQPGPQDR